MRRATALIGWVVVVIVGAGILGLVYGFSVPSRLQAGQRVVDSLSPAFTEDAAKGDRAGINLVSTAVNTLDPIVTPKGGASSEVPQLVAFVSAKTGLSQEQVLATLQNKFPHTTALLQTIPLTSVNDEIPGLVQFLATTLHTDQNGVLTALKQNFPGIYQSITQLPTVTKGWDAVPGTEQLTRFDGTPVRTTTDVRDYYSSDVIPVVEKNTTNMKQLKDWWPKVDAFPMILTVVGALAFGLGLLMIVFSLSTRRGRSVQMTAWVAVFLVGAAVFGLIFGAGLFVRLGGGDHLLSDATPIFTDARLAGDQATISYVGSVVDMADPIVTDAGGASSEVPKLVAFVSGKTGLTDTEVLGALTKNFPHTTALLQAIPLSSVTAELPQLVSFLGTVLNLTPTQVGAALNANFPHLAQAITYLPALTQGWNAVPGTTASSNMHTAEGVKAYFATTVIPLLAQNKADFLELNGHWPPLMVIAPLLFAISAVVMIWAGIFFFVALGVKRWRTGPDQYVPAVGSGGRAASHVG